MLFNPWLPITNVGLNDELCCGFHRPQHITRKSARSQALQPYCPAATTGISTKLALSVAR
jgi:hypothetical protein